MNRFVVFTDLDGTLLDHDTYDWQAARPALKRLRETKTPLIMVSSKTRVEIEALRTVLGNQDPFIPENGGAIFVPSDYHLDLPPEARIFDGYKVILLGRCRADLTALVDHLCAGLPVRALSHMDPAQIAELTGLTISQAEGARNREFGETFILDDPGFPESELFAAVHAVGLRLTKGGRFYHLLGENDKGRATEWLIRLFRMKDPDIVTAACGDAPNDEPMLAAVDRAFLVAGPDGNHRSMELPGLTRIPQPGPAGFNQAILKLFQ